MPDPSPALADLGRRLQWVGRTLLRARIPHRLRVPVALGTAALVLVAASPPMRWPVLRVVTAAATTVAAPVTPDVDSFGSLDRATTFLAAGGEVLLRLDGGRRGDPVTLGDLPDHVPRAVLAAEDRNFYEHGGVDPGAVARAAANQLTGGDQGGSTITQQLAKINFTGNDNTLVRKAREAMYAVGLEREFTKDQLLERYLNQVYFGDGAYGISAAAETFFGVPASALSLSQAALLAGKIRAPDALDPHDDATAVAGRRDAVLNAMRDEGWIDDETAALAKEEPLVVEPPADPPASRAPWFLEFVKAEAGRIEALGPDRETRIQRLVTDGYTVETTLDVAANDAAAEALRAQLSEPDSPSGAAVSVVPSDGAITIMVGGVDFARQQFNAAAQAQRSPGSAFKPFVYLAALREGIDPRSTFSGQSPQTFRDGGEEFEVRNYDERSYGTVTLDAALTKSINTVYMGLGLEVGAEDVVATAQRVGVNADLEEVPAVALGGTNPGLTPLDMAEAYATFAAEGTHTAPYSIRRIRDADGDVVYEHRPRPQEAIPREDVLVMNRPLLAVVEDGTGRAAALEGREVAGKTGTSSEFRDAWFVGYTPQLATAVWVGHLDNRSMEDTMGRISGGTIPARIFAAVMAAALDGVPSIPIATLSPAELDLKIMDKPGPTTTAPSTVPTDSTTSVGPNTSTVPAPAPTTSTAAAQPPGKGKDELPTTTTAPPTTSTAAPSG